MDQEVVVDNLLADAPGPADTADAAAAAKPADDKPAEAAGDKPAAADAKPAEEAAPATKAPESYEFKAPEGLEIDAALAAEFTPVLKDLDLTQEQADKLVAFAPKLLEPSIDAAVSRTLGALGYADCKDWAATAKADKEYGGDKLVENLGVIKAARDQFASPELRRMLETTPLGNNPEVLRLLYRVGKAISPDTYVPGGKTKSTSAAQSMYAESKMNP